ncbi:hypothetical protein Q7526_00400 [Glaesserella parasuis]|uniref:hypothetical protein n=1 Tax=Glaesserella parasuis TaxID=738 RepID=UPI0003AC42CA|nr:hypothetical protein [Glaesserella parasuis]ATW43332.1 hypothetical protein A2U20_05750 [Glaesserella parasuis D74]EQA10798.1 hypothetical protein HPSD74_0498 [Glaesserella parasuis D74]MDO9795696.1 hypothetical protein [Glaesserella parasuis]MDO9960580.1 hypothetical protein [Glaesserella parasuis]MDP0316678.1 hypothetical protein [Glaesserella parasuis]
MSENSCVTKPFSMLEYGSYTAGIGLILSIIIRFFIAPNYPEYVEIANLIAPVLTPVLSWGIALAVGQFGTTPTILRMQKNIGSSIKDLKTKIQENAELLPEKELKKLKTRLARHIDAKSLIGVSIHNEQDLLNYLNKTE